MNDLIFELEATVRLLQEENALLKENMHAAATRTRTSIVKWLDDNAWCEAAKKVEECRDLPTP